MLTTKDTRLLSAVLTGSKTQKCVGQQYGLSAAEMRVILAVAVLLGEHSSAIAATALTANHLAARTRLRAQVRAVVLAGFLTRRRRYGHYQLSLTAKGRAVVKAYTVAAYRAANAFLNPE
jgi:DNA-binding MarR family transcriptional regulator